MIILLFSMASAPYDFQLLQPTSDIRIMKQFFQIIRRLTLNTYLHLDNDLIIMASVETMFAKRLNATPHDGGENIQQTAS